ncbi:hypothetical protein FOA43_003422 [Brettanomyces nanus]|uniref:Uncharacterized protein n=1 Tax=Eeniella nana TaxID=13502 RepID=A0A875S3Z4_EENNA|nr:uncharacterized protein FOA43_003422 [Brettanomyces nanus]QPG76036.1 hypothetical protein FOA43_003422 [Brettanomyces nanus]
MRSFVSEMEHLQQKMFSSKLTTNVLSEFNDRYQKVRDENIVHIQKMNNNTTNAELNRRASNRFSKAHRSRFDRMDSIASHYATIRTKQQEQKKTEMQDQSQQQRHKQKQQSKPSPGQLKRYAPSSINRMLIEKDVSYPSMKGTTPGEKRSGLQAISSASKRQKMFDGDFVEIVESPTKEQAEKERIKKVHILQLKRSEAKMLTASNTLSNESIPQLHFSDTHVNENQLFQRFDCSPVGFSSSTPQRSVHASTPKDARRTKPTPPISKKHRIPSYLLPTKASLQKIRFNKDLSREDEEKEIRPASRKSTLPSCSGISPSRACSNLHSLLHNTRSTKIPSSQTYKDSAGLSSSPSLLFPPHNMPKSRTSSNIPRLAQPKISTIHRSPTSASLSKHRWKC